MALGTDRNLPPLSLSGSEPFARGSYRNCFVHPDDPNRCVKVPIRQDDPQAMAEQKRDFRDSLLLRRRKLTFDHMALVESRVATELGIGLVSRLCRDANGRISRNCGVIIPEQGLTPGLRAALRDLKEWLRDRRIPIRGLHPNNLVAQETHDDGWHLVIVEGLLKRYYDWPARRCRKFSDSVIDRRLRRLDRRIAVLAGRFPD